jgi:hypothetical protein
MAKRVELVQRFAGCDLPLRPPTIEVTDRPRAQRVQWSHVRWIFAVVAGPLILLCSIQFALAQSPTDLGLRSLGTVIIPDSLSITGALLSPDGQIVAWSGVTSRVVIVDRTGHWTAMGEGILTRPLGAISNTDGTIEVLDAAPPRLITLDPLGHHVSTVDFNDRWPLRAAAPSSESWFAVAEQADDWVVAELLRDGQHVMVSTIPHDICGSAIDPYFDIVFDDDHLIVSCRTPPYGGGRMEIDNPSEWSLFQRPRFLTDREARAVWLALAILPVLDGYVQSYADLTTDSRTAVAYDSTAAIIRETRMRAPLAFVASDRTRNLILGAARLDDLELIIYAIGPELSPP